MSQTRVITSEPDTVKEYAEKIWRYRSLIYTFAKRDIKVKYAQTYFGIFWVLLQPIPSVVVFTFFFGSLIKVDTSPLPYPVFALLGMIGWTYFTSLTSGIGNSLIESQHILKKIYFPKLILPFSKILSSGVDYVTTLMVVLVSLVLYSVFPSLTLLSLPIFLTINIVTGLAVGIWIAALTFRYRDFQHIAPFVINFSIWLTPVFYPSTVLPAGLEFIMNFNPMALVVAGYRYAFSGGQYLAPHLFLSLIPVVFLLVTGLLYFKKIEDEIADFV